MQASNGKQAKWWWIAGIALGLFVALRVCSYETSPEEVDVTTPPPPETSPTPFVPTTVATAIFTAAATATPIVTLTAIPAPTPTTMPTATPAAVPTATLTAVPAAGCTGLVISGREFATMTRDALEQRLREAGCSDAQIANSLSSFDGDRAKQDRWVEQYDHWANVDAFGASMRSINADRVIDKEESVRICFLFNQWIAQMESARNYVLTYREVEPETVEKNLGLQNLQAEAERAIALLSEIECA